MSLEHLVSLENYIPTVYKGCKEIEELIKSEDYLFDILISIIDIEYARMFIQTSDQVGVAKFENILRITADPTIETLEFRKQRLLTRCNSTLPYSTIWLRVYLNSVIGENNYELVIDYDNLKVTLYGFLLNYNWAREAGNTILQAKPCNMIFVNIPTVIQDFGVRMWFDSMMLNSTIWNDDLIWNEYKVLQISDLPNYNLETDGVNVNRMINSITGVRLNNGQAIVRDVTSYIQNNITYISFSVPNSISLLTYMELLQNNDNVIVETSSYIDTPSGTVINCRLTCYVEKEL